MRAVFPTVDVYPDWADTKFAQAIAVATPTWRPDTETLLQRAAALQQEFRFRYSLADVVEKRVTKKFSQGGELLTDDFAPADLYRVTPVGQAEQR